MLQETKVFTNRPFSPVLEEIADGVWLLRGDIKGGMNVYFLRDGDGVVQFDAGTRSMNGAVAAVGRRLGGTRRVVLGHGHSDHRATAHASGAPVEVHPDAVAETESDASIPPYFELEKIEVAPVRWIYPTLLRTWDGGAVKVSGTVSEGDEVAGFEVKEFPGHAPGLIGLWRESDRMAIVSDTVYLVDSARLKPLPAGQASVPHPAFAWNHEMAKDSVRKLAALEPKMVCPGHEHPIKGVNLRGVLEAAAERYPEDARPA